MKKSNFDFYSLLFFMLSLFALIISNKYVYLAPNLYVSARLIIYPFTFLVLSLMDNRQSIIRVKRILFYTFILLLVFYLLISIINSIDSVTSTKIVNENLRELFTPNYFIINKMYFYYPDLITLVTYSLILFLSHYIFIVNYDVFGGYVNDKAGYILSYILSFIIDQILFIPLISIKQLIDLTISYKNFIENLTASFIVVMFSTIITFLIYVIAKKRN